MENKTANAVCQLSPFWNTNERVESLITEIIFTSRYFWYANRCLAVHLVRYKPLNLRYPLWHCRTN